MKRVDLQHAGWPEPSFLDVCLISAAHFDCSLHAAPDTITSHLHCTPCPFIEPAAVCQLGPLASAEAEPAVPQAAVSAAAEAESAESVVAPTAAESAEVGVAEEVPERMMRLLSCAQPLDLLELEVLM